MEPEQRQILRRWRVELVESISVLGRLYTHLLSKNILSGRAVKRIKNNRIGEEQVEELLDELQKKDCFDQFCEALIADGQEYIVNKYLKQTTPVDGRQPDVFTATTASYSGVQNHGNFITLSQNTTARNLNISQITSSRALSGPSDVLTPSEVPLPIMSMSPPVRDPGFMDQFGLSRSDAVDLRSQVNHSSPLLPYREVSCPTLTSDEIDIDLRGGCVNVKVEHCSEEFFHCNYKKSYPMRRIPRGCALIINVNEVVGKPARTGTNFDRDNLCNLLSQLHFNITVYDDKDGLSAQEMVLKLKSFAKLEQHRQADACFICLLSHGEEEEYIFGTDGKQIPLNEIFMLFDNNNCKGLIGKPKVFVIQACRGGSLDRGIMLDETDGGSVPNRSGSQLPSMSDMLICYPPIMGYYAWQHQARGSWYIEAIVQIFMRYAKNEDMCAMLNRVNRLVSRKVSESCLKEMNQMLQMCKYKSILCYPHLYLFPGIAIKNTPSTEPAESIGEQEIIGSQGQQTQSESPDRQLRRNYVSDIAESVAKLNIV